MEALEVNTIKIGVFFDGTGNNGYNSTAINGLKDSSYISSPSNIFRLYNNYKNESKKNINLLAVYVEGIGTLTNQTDSLLNQATGDYGSYYGASDKIKFAVEDIHQELSQALFYNQFNEKLKLEFDLFGFSRGAALARHFANLISDKKSKEYKQLLDSLKQKNKILESISINFIGLFDTVESFIFADFNTSLSNIKANCIYQLKAMHECRKNFPITSILNKEYRKNADGIGSGYNPQKDKNHFEFYVPGCHADVGGGYMTNEIEQTSVACCMTKDKAKKEVVNIKKNSLWAKLLDDNNIKYENSGLYSYAISRRNFIGGELQWVYAYLMLETAIKFGCPFNKDSFSKIYDIPLPLNTLFNELRQKNNLLLEKSTFPQIDQSIIDGITLNYIHISANYDILAQSTVGPDTVPLKKNIINPLNKNQESIGQSELITTIDAAFYRVNQPEEDWVRKYKE